MRRRLATAATVLALTLAPAAIAPAAQAAETAAQSTVENTGDYPRIWGSFHAGETLEITPGEWTPGAKFSYQWMRNGQPVPGATGHSYKLEASDIGAEIRATMVASLDGRFPQTVDLYGTKVGKFRLEATGSYQQPLTGSPRVGSVLTAPINNWYADARGIIPDITGSQGLKLSYQWYRYDEKIQGAVHSTYTPSPSDLGSFVKVVVTARHEYYESASRPSLPEMISAGALAAGAPTVSGRVKVGHKLTAAPGAWPKGTSFAYRWYADGKAITGASTRTFTPQAPQARKKLSVKVTGTLAGYSTASRTSAVTVAVAASPAVKGSVPTITGTGRMGRYVFAEVGKKLTARPGTWSKGATLSYQWYAGGKAIKGATRSTFTPTAKERSARISVKITGSRTGYASTTKSSKVLFDTSVGETVGATPKVTGAPRVGKTLTAHTGKWTRGTKFSYQWRADGREIKGATKSTFKLKAAQRGKSIAVVVTGTQDGYMGLVKASAWTRPVAR